MLLEQAPTRRARYRWVAGAPDPGMASGATTRTARATIVALVRAVLGAGTVLAIVRLDIWEPSHIAVPTLLAAAWLCAASLLHLAGLELTRLTAPVRRGPGIPLRFAGSTGRFVLRRLGRARVEVRAGSEVVAEVVADDLGDELVVYDVESLSEAELPELGSAIGQAMEMTVAATRTGTGYQNPFE